MAFNATTSEDGRTLEIVVSGRFQFSVHREFRDTYTKFTVPGGLVRINLAQTEYMDSAALGMILLLNEHVKQHRARIVLSKPSAMIRRILDIANFDKLFVIEA
jgi:anti-anti-sigma factor